MLLLNHPEVSLFSLKKYFIRIAKQCICIVLAISEISMYNILIIDLSILKWGYVEIIGKNIDILQVNTSIAGSENYAPALADPRSNISISDSFVNSVASLGETSASIEIQTDTEVVDAVDAGGSSEHDPILEDNTVAIMGQVTSSGTVLLNENSDAGKTEEMDAANGIDANNVIVISMMDEGHRRKETDIVVTQDGEPVPNAIILPSSAGRREPVPTAITMNKNAIKGSEEPEIIIERKRVYCYNI